MLIMIMKRGRQGAGQVELRNRSQEADVHQDCALSRAVLSLGEGAGGLDLSGHWKSRSGSGSPSLSEESMLRWWEEAEPLAVKLRGGVG